MIATEILIIQMHIKSKIINEAFFRIKREIISFLPIRPLNPVHYGSEISILNGNVHHVFQTYGVIMTRRTVKTTRIPCYDII